ncbi:XrtA/PEP-CTERM system TPR-repeat protein PrsT [Vibrio ziniensis]|uniref:PEP-CTERM system TPR-repeat protein PrsT n=1 Tax=Vibrio ziniensis TaxID=2711221 RepID=A0A6G7CMM9_9VIBR|nr:XrtA/PEP-CTERM system TPR-repeat protein PrsT [Vibrio ziniensis]QIH43306.1 PEP-CTERM system TPR-repeat protein PrsT [Vibrio ziniensis]
MKNTVIVFATTSLFYCYPTLADKYLDNAQKYIEKNEIPSAVIELKNSIQNSPDDAKPRLLLGKIYLQQGGYLEAEKELSKALELGSPNEEVITSLLNAKLNLGKNQEVINTVSDSRVSDPYINSELFALKSMAELNLNQVDSARQSLQLAGDAALDSHYVKLSQARLDATQNNIEQAIRLVDEVIDKDDTNTDAWILKGHLEMAKRDFAKAAESYSKAYQLSPKASQYTLFLSRALVLDNQMDKAQPYIDNILKQIPNQVLANEMKASIDFSKSNFESAKQHADRAINNGSENLVTMLISGVASYNLKLYEQSNHRLKQILPRLPEDHFARRLYIVTQLKLGYIDEAIQEAERLNVDSKENSTFLSQTSMELSKLGRDEEALTLAKKAYESDKGQFNEMMLGMVKLSSHDSSGIEDLKSALAEQPDKRKAEIGIGYYYLQLGAIDEAQNVADKWLKSDTNDVDALVLHGTILLSQSQSDQASDAYLKALSIDPDHIQGNLLYSRLLASREQWEQAFQYAYKTKTLAPNNELATKLLFISGQKANKAPELLKLINTQISQNPTNLNLVPQKAIALVLNNETTQALNLLEKQPEQNKTAKMWALIGNIYFSKKQWSDAERAYLKWLDIAPTDVDAHIRSIFISGMTKKYGSGIALANNASQIFPTDIRFTILKIDLLIKSGKTDDAQKLLDTMTSSVRDLEYTLKQQAVIYISDNLLDKAIPVLQKRYKTYPGLESAKELSLLYVQNNQAEEAIKFLSEVINQYPDKARALQLLLADIQSKQSSDEAIEQYKVIIKREPNNVIALNNLSWVYMGKENFIEACQYSKRAYDLADGHPQIDDTHGYCLLKSGEIKEAVSILKKAYQAVSANPEIALHYTESLIADNQIRQAQLVLDGIVTNNSVFLEQKKALEVKLSSL